MKIFSKRILTAVIALVLCVSVAIASYALPSALSGLSANPVPDRQIIVPKADGSYTEIQDDFIGYGDNHWDADYHSDMNDSFQEVFNSRTNRISPGFMRMVFMPHWLMYTDRSIEEQEAAWEVGNYNTNNRDYLKFMRNIEMFARAGTVPQVNFGWCISDDAKVTDWFIVEDSNRTDGISAAPKNLDAYAQACAFLMERVLKIWDKYCVEDVNDEFVRLSFYNETQGPSWEAFGDEREYWCEMIKKIHYELEKTPFYSARYAAKYNKHTDSEKTNARDYIEIVGSEVSGNIGEIYIQYVYDYIDENIGRFTDGDSAEFGDGVGGEPFFEIHSNHPYPRQFTTAHMIEQAKFMTSKYPDILPTESHHGLVMASDSGASAIRNYTFGYGDFAQLIIMANAGWSGYCGFVYAGAYMGDPHNNEWNLALSMWSMPSKKELEYIGTDRESTREVVSTSQFIESDIPNAHYTSGLSLVGHTFGFKSLGMRYSLRHSRVLESQCTLGNGITSATDIMATTLVKDFDENTYSDDAISIFVDVNDVQKGDNDNRVIAVNVGKRYAGMTFRRHDARLVVGDKTLEPDANGLYPTAYYDHTVTYRPTNETVNGITTGGENAIIPPSFKSFTVNEDGIFYDVLPNEHTYVLYTSAAEAIQVEMEPDANMVDGACEKYVLPTEDVTFKIEKVYGVDPDYDFSDDQECNFEIMGKTTAEAISNSEMNGFNNRLTGDTAEGQAVDKYESYKYKLVQADCGSIEVAADGMSATYNATGTTVGDCIAIKVYPKCLEGNDAEIEKAYAVVIVNIVDEIPEYSK